MSNENAKDGMKVDGNDEEDDVDVDKERRPNARGGSQSRQNNDLW